MNILVIIPARGGSKGIPRKNLRKIAGRPLISYSIKTALSINPEADVYVTSEDPEILSISKMLGSKIHKRPAHLSDDHVTLDSVVYDAYINISRVENKDYDYIITMQPTSPTLKVGTVNQALKRCIEGRYDTVISVCEERHLSWKRDINNNLMPVYALRQNRQQLPPIFVETGGFVVSKPDDISDSGRFGEKILPYVIQKEESIDIDDYMDWAVCEHVLGRIRVLIVVSGNRIIGMGHVYNSLIIAGDLASCDVTFLVDKKSDSFAYEKIKSNNYKVFCQKSDDLIEDVVKYNPSLVINDRLDNEYSYIAKLKEENIKCICIEDVGEGARYAEIVINAIYTEPEFNDNRYYGYMYYILRDEFYFRSTVQKTREKVTNVLLTFGGVDPCNLTKKVLSIIYPYCIDNNINIIVVAGIGYDKYQSLSEYSNVDIMKDVADLSEIMFDSDIVFSSMGRTSFEIASLAVPAILMAQNSRELTHSFGFAEQGFINLGLGSLVDSATLKHSFESLVESQSTRKHMQDIMKNFDIRLGRKRVIGLINRVIGEINED